MPGGRPSNRVARRDTQKTQDRAIAARARLFTPCELKVLRALVDRRSFPLNKLELAKLAGVSRAQFYKIIKDPWFLQQYQCAVMDAMGLDFAAVMSACLETAKMIGRGGHADRKLIFTMMGLVQEDPKEGGDSHTHYHMYGDMLEKALARATEKLEDPKIVDIEPELPTEEPDETEQEAGQELPADQPYRNGQAGSLQGPV